VDNIKTFSNAERNLTNQFSVKTSDRQCGNFLGRAAPSLALQHSFKVAKEGRGEHKSPGVCLGRMAGGSRGAGKVEGESEMG